MFLFDELKERKVFRVGAAYAVAAWIALQVFDLVLDNVDAPAWVMQALIAVVVLGFPLVLVLAWALDVTPEGRRASPASQSAFAGLVAAISVMLLGAVGWYLLGGRAVDEAVVPPAATASAAPIIDSIAVLPFASFSSDSRDAYFADGLADTLLNKLAQLPTLKVIARNSSFQFRGTNRDAREIGRLLGVASLLEGSVQREGDRIRVIAQLIETANGTHLWSESYDDSFENIFDLQDRLAQAIMRQLQVSISERDRQRVLRNGTDSPEAYDLLMRAVELPERLDATDFDPENDPVLALIDRALAIDPDYAQAWAERAGRFTNALFFDSDPSSFASYIVMAREAAAKAIETDPGYPGAHVAMAETYFREQALPECEAHLRRALELDPNDAVALRILGLAKLRIDPQRALELFTHARELDPRSTFIYRQIYFALSALGRHEEARAILAEGVDRFPEEPILLGDLANLHASRFGQPAEAGRWASRVVAAAPASAIGPGLMSGVWLAVADRERAAQWTEQLARIHPRASHTADRRAAIAVLAGQPGRARELIDAVPESPSHLLDRATAMGGACLLLADGECLRAQADRLEQVLAHREATGSPNMAAERYALALAILRGAAAPELTAAERAALETGTRASRSWPVTMGRGSRHKGYLRAMALTLLGEYDAAVEDLGTTLELDGGGFLPADIFRLPPDMNPLLGRLAGTPGYESWLAEFRARRARSHAELVELEARGELAAAADVSN